MKKLIYTIAILCSTGTLFAQNNLGVDQANPQAKVHVTNSTNQKAMLVEDEANDATPFVIDSVGNVGIGARLTTDSLMIPTNASNGAVLTSDASGNASWQPVLPPGVIMPFMGTTPPAGWLLCDGSAVSRTTYANLYAVIGITNGWGDPSGTLFNLPDLRGRFLRGADNGAGNDPDASSRIAQNTNGNTGDNVGSYQIDEFKSHNHGGGATPAANLGNIGSVERFFDPVNTGNTGGNETRPINVYVNYIIKH